MAGIRTIDYAAFWAGVDENGPSPVLGVLPVLQARQEEMRVKDAVEEFLEQYCCEVGGATSTRAAETFDRFKVFLDYDNRPKAHFTASKFGRRIKALLGPSKVKKSNGVWYNLALKPTRWEETLDAAKAAANEPMHPTG